LSAGRAATAWVILFLAATASAQQTAPHLTPAQIAQIATRSVVLIRTPTGLGSGFVAAANGKIVTNFHVIRDATQASVVTSDRVEHHDVEVIALDETHDLAVLRIGARKLEPLALADSSLAKPGEHVVAIGNPLLNECPRPQVQVIVGAISQAINSGAPLYNQGNFEACYRIYEGAALGVQQTVQQCQGPKQALADGIDNAKKLPGWSDKAWAMRDAFDGILALAAPKAGGAAVKRNIPLVPLSVIDACPTEDLTSIGESIGAAIASTAAVRRPVRCCKRACRTLIESPTGRPRHGRCETPSMA
jgi:hypothetical protein